MKSVVTGTHFASLEAVKIKNPEYVEECNKKEFQHCFQQCKKRMGQYIST